MHSEDNDATEMIGRLAMEAYYERASAGGAPNMQSRRQADAAPIKGASIMMAAILAVLLVSVAVLYGLTP
jgi:hypothetical protein